MSDISFNFSLLDFVLVLPFVFVRKILIGVISFFSPEYASNHVPTVYFTGWFLVTLLGV